VRSGNNWSARWREPSTGTDRGWSCQEPLLRDHFAGRGLVAWGLDTGGQGSDVTLRLVPGVLVERLILLRLRHCNVHSRGRHLG
jgi:hypothetical protein